MTFATDASTLAVIVQRAQLRFDCAITHLGSPSAVECIWRPCSAGTALRRHLVVIMFQLRYEVACLVVWVYTALLGTSRCCCTWNLHVCTTVDCGHQVLASCVALLMLHPRSRHHGMSCLSQCVPVRAQAGAMLHGVRSTPVRCTRAYMRLTPSPHGALVCKQRPAGASRCTIAPCIGSIHVARG